MSENLPESLEWLDRALKIYERIAALRPTDSRFQSSLAACCSEVGLYLSYRKEVEPSLAHLNRARTILQKLVDSHPDQIDFKKDLAEVVNRMGYVDFTRRDFPAALEHYKEFQKLCLEILEEVKVGPKPLKFQDMLARSYFNIAAMYREPEDAQRSLDASGKAAEYWSKLVDIAPSVTSYQVDLGGAYYSKAWTEYQLGRGSEALASVDQALAIFDRLIKDEPENLDYQVEKGAVLNLKGGIYYEARQNDQATLRPFSRPFNFADRYFEGQAVSTVARSISA